MTRETQDFWSRRRAAVAAEAQADAEAAEAAVRAEHEALQETRSDADLLAEAGLPDPTTVTNPEQVRDFLASALPQRLKRQALRQLWGMNPVLANVDGLVDYGEDFTDAATVVENLQTVYEVGRGMVAKLEELAAVEEAGAQPPSDETAPPTEEMLPDIPAEDLIAEASVPNTPQPYQQEETAPLPATARRMRFATTMGEPT